MVYKVYLNSNDLSFSIKKEERRDKPCSNNYMFFYHGNKEGICKECYEKDIEKSKKYLLKTMRKHTLAKLRELQLEQDKLKLIDELLGGNENV